MTYTRAEDNATALQAAVVSMSGRFEALACLTDEATAAAKTLEVADIYLRWLRKLDSGRLVLVAIEDKETGEVVRTPIEGEIMPANINSGQRARYTFHAKDTHGFEADYALAARSGSPAVATVEYFQVGDAGNTTNGATNPDGTSAEFDQVLVTFAGTFGDTMIEVYDPAGDTSVVIASDVVTAGPSDIGTGTLGEAGIEETPPAV